MSNSTVVPMPTLLDREGLPKPTVMPLGDAAVLLRFGAALSDGANRAAIAFAAELDRQPVAGMLEVAPNLVSVLVRYDPLVTSFGAMAGELRLRLSTPARAAVEGETWAIPIEFDGLDLDEVAAELGLTRAAFSGAHNAQPLRVLATGFAPGFVYCGLHPDTLTLPRRAAVRPAVSPGTVLFAAGQTAITATEMPTGWHIIGHTAFNNFDAEASQPTRLKAGDLVRFTVQP